MRKLLMAGACALSMICAADAATVVSIKQGYALKLEGMITEGDDFRIHDAYRKSCIKYHHCPERIFLASEGGYMDAAVDAGDIVRFLELDTVVDKQVTCASACFMIFANGKHRVARDGAFIGVHQTYDAETGKTDREMQAYFYGVMRGWRVPEAIRDKFMATSSDDMGWLTGADAGDWIEIIN